MIRSLLALSLAAWLVSQSSPARADPAAAEALFREGRALLARGEIESACQKLEASHELEPSSGTLLNLAACRLKQGKTATAWAHFVSAQRLADNQGRPEQAEEAKQRALELEPKLSTLTLVVKSPPPGLEVLRAGKVVQAGSFGVRVPVDPGTIEIEASAPGYEPVRLVVTVGDAGDQHVLDLPSLRRLSQPTNRPAARAPSSPAARAGEPAEPGDGPGATPWVIAAAGGAALVAGSVFGVMALSSDAEAKEQCDQRTSECPDDAVQTAERRDREALASTIAVGVGVVGVGVAAIWLLSSESSSEESAWSWDGDFTRESAVLRVRAGF